MFYLKLHDLTDIINCFTEIEVFLEELELVILYSTYVKGIFDNILEVDRAVVYYSEEFTESCI